MTEVTQAGEDKKIVRGPGHVSLLLATLESRSHIEHGLHDRTSDTRARSTEGLQRDHNRYSDLGVARRREADHPVVRVGFRVAGLCGSGLYRRIERCRESDAISG